MQRRGFPDHVLPQLSAVSPSGPPVDASGWIHEIKLDGFRLLAKKDGESVDFFTRRGHRWSDKFSAIAGEIRRLPVHRLWIDGEITVMLPDGRSCFGSLQEAIARKDQGRLSLYAFDLMWCDGDLFDEPLIRRKDLLSGLLRGDLWNLQYVEHFIGDGQGFFETVCDHGLEGIISKCNDSIYLPGRRSRNWLKSKSESYRSNVAWKWWQKKRRCS